MSITKNQFRCLLVIYVIVAVVPILAEDRMASTIPDVVKDLEPPGFQPSKSLLLNILTGLFLISVLCAALVGFIGMFCLWSPARYIYLIAVFFKITYSPLTLWMVHTGWRELFGEMEIFLDGVILTLCLLGSAKHLFESKTKVSPPRNLA
jgi:hypothetical protein